MSAIGPEPASASGRIAGLDAWRAVLMLGGFLVHASLWQEQRAAFDVIALISHTFRMGAFFAISGFLSGIAVTRRSSGRWLATRLVRIGVPLLFGLAIICPLMTFGLMHFLLPGVAGPGPLALDWFHLWFLVALLLYALCAHVADRLDRRFGLFDRLLGNYCARAAPIVSLLLGTAAISFILMVATAALVTAVSPAPYLKTLLQWHLIAGYAPNYLLGYGLAKACGLRAKLLADSRSPLGIVAMVMLTYVAWFGVLAPHVPASQRLWWDGMIPVAGAAMCSPAAFILILRAAIAVRAVPRFVTSLADASFTMYIVHLPLILAINLVLARVSWNPYFEFALCVVLSGLLSYGLHIFLVRPSPLFSFLLNGKLPRVASGLPAADRGGATEEADFMPSPSVR